MPKGKSKPQSIEALHYTWHYSGLGIQVTPEDFISIVLEKDLIVIRRKETRKGFYYYYAFGQAIFYYTRSRYELPEIHVDVLVPNFHQRVKFKG